MNSSFTGFLLTLLTEEGSVHHRLSRLSTGEEYLSTGEGHLSTATAGFVLSGFWKQDTCR
ncbi:hypothetical protein Taro_000699, partial [Colocasia esculenta]|nr:hypothetical protein [Colocasia esculenta]